MRADLIDKRFTIAMLLATGLAVPGLLTAGAPSGHFTDSGGGVVTDNATGLSWEQGASGDLTWSDAVDYCENLLLGGHGDWRLPSMKEIQTLVVETQTNPALDTELFSEAAGLRFWTSSQPPEMSGFAWLFDSAIGHSYAQETAFEVRARCVR